MSKIKFWERLMSSSIVSEGNTTQPKSLNTWKPSIFIFIQSWFFQESLLYKIGPSICFGRRETETISSSILQYPQMTFMDQYIHQISPFVNYHQTQ